MPTGEHTQGGIGMASNPLPSIALEQGDLFNLEQRVPGLGRIALGLGWDIRRTPGQPFDLDASILMLNAQNKAIGSGGFVFYNNWKSSCGSVAHSGDNRTGIGEGDDEFITIDLGLIPEAVTKLLIAVTIHDAASRGQTFGMVDNAFVRVVNLDGNREILRYDLTQGYSDETGLIFGDLRLEAGQWQFFARGDSFPGGLKTLLAAYGLGASV